jgi:hypothetical protein
MRAQSKTRDLDARMNEIREIAARFFAVEKLDKDTITNLKTLASRLGGLVDECGKIKGSL